MLVAGVVGYVVLVVVGVGVAAVTRWRHGHAGSATAPGVLRRPGDVAFLSGGNLAVVAAVAALRVDPVECPARRGRVIFNVVVCEPPPGGADLRMARPGQLCSPVTVGLGS